jgi:type IV pilus assembly protein PilE
VRNRVLIDCQIPIEHPTRGIVNRVLYEGIVRNNYEPPETHHQTHFLRAMALPEIHKEKPMKRADECERDTSSRPHAKDSLIWMRGIGRSRGRGFTLIEVMIVVAIVGILAAIALPSYNDYIRRGQIQEAFGFLSDFRAKMEQYYQDNRNYGSASECASDPTAGSLKGFTPPNAKYFKFECVIGGAQQTYVIRARGISGQAKGHIYTIDQAGARETEQFKGAAVVPGGCWMTRAANCSS